MMSPVSTPADQIVDPHLAAAIDQAREVLAADVPEDQIGDHVDVVAEAELVATHLFACTNPGYVGWNWAVSVTRVPDSDDVTVNETVLLPGQDSLLAPAWLPWEERVAAGDLRPGDVLPTAPDDPRLEPGYTGSDQDTTEDDDLVPVLWELGLGRVRVLSMLGRDEAATRWAHGDGGPTSPIAKAARDQCSTCGFLVPMSGPLGQAFGLCANEYSPDDGRVVTLDHGCGAHSEAVAEPVAIATLELVVDDRSPDNLDTSELTEAELATPEPDQTERAEASASTDVSNADVSDADVSEVSDVSDSETPETPESGEQPSEES